MTTPTYKQGYGLGLSSYLSRSLRCSGVAAADIDLAMTVVNQVLEALAAGHTCLDLDALYGSRGETVAALLKSIDLAVDTGSDQTKPLVIDKNNFVYLYRYYRYEQRFARALLRRILIPIATDDEEATVYVDAYFNAGSDAPGVDWQRFAALTAMRNRFSVISGGPGTGKTTTAVAILACMLARWPDAKVILAAPTGKAAARMQSAVSARMAELPAHLRALVPQTAVTVHRLLGFSPGSSLPRFGSRRPLTLDILIVDEASMLDLALATKLFEALPAEARIVLLGDKDQLAAVEPGAVFSTLAYRGLGRESTARASPVDNGTERRANPLHGTAVWLRHNFRFAGPEGIGQLAALVRDFRDDVADELMTVLQENPEQIAWLATASGPLTDATLDCISAPFLTALPDVADAIPDMELFRALDRYVVLSGLRHGPRGTRAINEAITRRVLRYQGQLLRRGDAWYAGRPVMVTGNDYALRVFNGDVGIAWPDGDGRFKVWFATPAGDRRAVAAGRLPTHETAYCLTVHKSQGSEYDAVAFILPSAESPVLTRELIYTAVTRVRRAVTLVGEQAALLAGCRRSTVRAGGLWQRILEAAEKPSA